MYKFLILIRLESAFQIISACRSGYIAFTGYLCFQVVGGMIWAAATMIIDLHTLFALLIIHC